MAVRPRISREFLEEHRRRRFVEATAEILHEFGRPGVTTTNVVRLAGGARNSFYEVFSSVEDCIAHGIVLVEAELFAGLRKLPGDGDWAGEVHQAIAGFYAAVAERPVLAELFLIHSAASREEEGRRAFREGGARFAPLIARGTEAAEFLGLRPPPATLPTSLSWAIVYLAAARVRGPEVAELPGRSRQMSALVAGYYLGRENLGDAAGRLGPRR
jgi:AcrR family transcriptional regulator